MGKGVAIAPSDGRIYAPFDGIVQLIFPTRHAVGVVSDSGLVTLIHIGIGTVKLKGVGFVSYVERGQHVKKGDLLIEFWDPTIKKEGLDDTIIITILNSNELTNFNILKNADEDIVSLEPLFIVKK
jgi:lactose/raffinose/galactose permease